MLRSSNIKETLMELRLIPAEKDAIMKQMYLREKEAAL